MGRRIDYFFTVVSPWSYLGHVPFMRIAREHGVEVAYKPFPVGRIFPETGGLPLAKRHPARQAYRLIELQRWREHRGVPMKIRPQHWPFDSTLIDKTIIALTLLGEPVESVLPAAYDGVFENELDLASPAVIAGLLDKARLNAPHVLEEAESEKVASVYEANLAEALEKGVFGAPVYVLDGELFWGQDRLVLLEEALRTGRAAFLANV